MGKISTASRVMLDGHEAKFQYFLTEPDTGLCRVAYRDFSFTMPNVFAEKVFHSEAEVDIHQLQDERIPREKHILALEVDILDFGDGKDVAEKLLTARSEIQMVKACWEECKKEIERLKGVKQDE